MVDVDWSDERYVRLYTRNTADWLEWPWQARALFPLLLRAADRAGRVELGRRGARTLAVVVGLPPEVVEVGLAALLDDGCVLLDGAVALVRNFLPAQEAVRSPAARQREHREASRAQTFENARSPVTKRDEMSRGSERCHAVSRDVTPAVLPVPSSASSTREDSRLSSPACAGDAPSVLGLVPPEGPPPPPAGMAPGPGLYPEAAGSEGRPARAPAADPEVAAQVEAVRQHLAAESSPAAKPQVPDPVEVVFALWNGRAGQDLPRASRLTPKRRKKIAAALKLVPLDEWPRAIDAVNAWTWRGEDGTWRPDLDWLLATDKHGTENILRAAEGQLGGKRKLDVRKNSVRAEDIDWSGQVTGPVDFAKAFPEAPWIPKSKQ